MASKKCIANTKRKANKNGNQTSKNRYDVNFKNPKVLKVISYLELAENRISKPQFDSIANKDIYYKLLHNGFIKKQGSLIVGTDKLRKYVKAHYSSSFSSSCSQEHALQISKVLNLVPESVLLRRSYSTSGDIEKSFKRFIITNEGQAKLRELENSLRTHLANVNMAHSDFFKSPHTDTEIFLQKLHYKKEREKCLSHLELFKDTPYLTPDMQLRFTKDEYLSFCQELKNYSYSLSGNEKEVCKNAISKLESLQVGSGGITINVEIVTNTYMEREYFRHMTFEQLSNVPQIYLM